jgi:hypothetical protein
VVDDVDGCSGRCGKKEKENQQWKVNHDQINTNITITNKRVASSHLMSRDRSKYGNEQ